MCWNEWQIKYAVFELRSILSSKFFENWPNLTTKSTISQKLKIVSIGKLIFHSFQHIRKYGREYVPSYDRLCSQFTCMSPWIYQVCHIKKIIYCPKKCALFWHIFFSSWCFFVRVLVFEIWSILDSTFVVYWSGTWTNSDIFLCYGGTTSLNPPVSWGASPSTPPAGAPPLGPKMLYDWILLENWLLWAPEA